LEHICPRAAERRTPEIHLGYYTRVEGIRKMAKAALAALGDGAQVLDVGAGSDTLYWRLKDDPDVDTVVRRFVEVDLPGVTSRKVAAVRRSQTLMARVAAGSQDEDVRVSRTDLHASDYHVVAADLTRPDSVEAKLRESAVDFSAPTLIIAECVFVYLEPAATSAFLSWLAKRFAGAPLVLVAHEQINMNDRFGQVMLDNLRARGCPLRGVPACADKTAQEARYSAAGWSGARVWTMGEVYPRLDNVAKVEALEMFDERELLQQLLEHYCLVAAWREGHGLALADVNWL